MKLGNFLMVSDQRGKHGGTVYSRTRSGHIARARVKPKNPRSDSQTNVRALMAAGARFAKASDPADVLLWKDYANGITRHQSVSGAAYHPSWITALTQLYIPFFLADPGGTFPDTPPTTPYTGDSITLEAAGGVGEIVVTGSAQQTAGQTTFIYLERLASQNRTPTAKEGKLSSVAAVPATPFEVTIGSLTPGFYVVRAKFVKKTTGQESNIQTLGTVEVTS